MSESQQETELGLVNPLPTGQMDLPASLPEAQGIEADVMDRVDAFVAAGMPELHGIVLVRHGHLVGERYWGAYERDFTWAHGGVGLDLPLGEPYQTCFDPSQVHNVKSVTKSVLSALVGIAVDQGIVRLDHTVGDLLAGELLDDMDPRKRQISLQALLEMRSGLEWSEYDMIVARWVQSGDPLGFTLGREQRALHAPGEHWEYSTADSHIISACLQKATGMTALAFADRHLFAPLGITQRRWSHDNRGYTIGGSELCLAPRDMAKLGELYLRDGRCGGAQIVPAQWVRASTSPQAGVDGETTTGYLAEAGLAISDAMLRYREGYGRHWWRGDVGGHHIYYAAGHGGQYIFVFEDLDLVVVQVATSRLEPHNQTVERIFSGYRLMEQVVLPAVR